MGLAEKAGTGEVVILDPASLKAGPKVRRERIDVNNVNALEPVIEDCPPITVNYPSLTIVDGHHRQAAAVRRKVGIRAVLVSLTTSEMFEQAVHLNVTHGLALSLAERKSNAERMVKESGEWSDRRIAEACGLAATTVADLRPKVSNRSSGQLDTSKRDGADGKRRPASPAAQRAVVDAEIKANPAAPAREVARKTGASPTTVAARKAHLAAVPDRSPDAPPSVGDLVVMAPTVWKDEAAIQRTNATREFGRFMDRFTRWNNKAFSHWVTTLGPECPADLKREAETVARAMSAGWSRLADDLTKHDLSEAK